MNTRATNQAFPPSSITLESARRTDGQIRWPEKFLPAKTQVFAHNEIMIPAAPERIWAWLIRAQLWPQWYANSSNIHFLSHTGPDLRDRSRFRWKTFGVRITSKVLEYQPNRRLAWDAQGIGVHAYHAWLLTPVSDGRTHVLTEETQSGWLAKLGAAMLPNRLYAKHQLWLEGLSAKAQAGLPPKGTRGVPEEVTP